MMRIAVTGASGFIGREFVKTLPDSVDLLLLSRHKRTGYTETDYSYDSLIHLLSNADLVVHLASVRGHADNYGVFQENEILTENILKAMCASGCRHIIYMSSIAVYSDQIQLPWREDQKVSPQTFYGLSKATGEYLCHLYASRGIQYTIFRCGIVFGLDNIKRMISTFIRQASKKEQLVLSGKSIAKRDFVYVKEVAAALMWAAMEMFSESETYNLGSGEAYTNLEIAEEVNVCFENVGNLVYNDSVEEQVINSYMSSDKLYSVGYKRKWTLQTALEDIKDEIKSGAI